VRTPVVPTVLAAAVLLAVSGCGSNDSSQGTDEAPSVTATSTAPAVTTAPTITTTSAAPVPTTASPTPSVQQVRITVAGGKVTGDTGLVSVKKGVPFQVVVTSDVADEVHVHSETRAGFPGDVAAGGTVTVDAVIKVAGKYEVELEERKLRLATLEVR
jgi:hypothetical protein